MHSPGRSWAALGPGLFEHVYKVILAYEFSKQHLAIERQVGLPTIFKPFPFAYLCVALREALLSLVPASKQHLAVERQGGLSTIFKPFPFAYLYAPLRETLLSLVRANLRRIGVNLGTEISQYN
jgi:hypothetical protein